MAQSGATINILSNVREAVRGVDDVADAVEEVGERLHDLTKEGDTATDRMEGDFRDLTKAADKSADALKDKFRAAYKSVKNSADDAADDAIRAQRRMGEKSAEVGQEIRQNLGEGIANAARGDFESLSDTIGDTFGGAVAGIGGIGFAAAGAAGAVGIGLLVAAFQSVEEHRKKLEERAADLGKAYVDAGTNVLDAMAIASRASEYLTDTSKREETKRLSEVLGIDMRDAARALAGDMNALGVANKIVEEGEQERLDLMQQSASYMSGEFTSAEKVRLAQLLDQQSAVNDLNNVNNSANDTFREQQKLLNDLVNEAASATKEVDELGNELYTLPDGTQVMVSADTGQATTDVSKFKGDLDGVPEVITSTMKIVVDDWAVRAYKPPTFYADARVVLRPGEVRWQ